MSLGTKFTRRNSIKTILVAYSSALIPAPVLAASLGQAMSGALDSGAFLKLLLQAIVQNFASAGFNGRGIEINYSAGGMATPSARHGIGISQLGIDPDDWSSGLEDVLPQITRTIEAIRGEVLFDEDMLGQAIEASKRFQDRWEGVGETGYLIEAAAIVTIFVGVLTVFSMGFAVGFGGAQLIWNNLDSDGDGVRNELDKEPYNEKRSYKADFPDLDGDGKPDFDDLMVMSLMRSAGLAVPDGEKIGVQFGLQLRETSLVVDCAYSIDPGRVTRVAVDLTR